jgi:hypothetical protein
MEKLAPLEKCNAIVGKVNNNILAGVGLHDSSSALIPYLLHLMIPLFYYQLEHGASV